MYSAIHVIYFELPTEEIEDQSNIIYPNCTESHCELYVSFLSSFLYLRPYALTRDEAEAYDVSFCFIFSCSLLLFLIWFGFQSIERKLMFELGGGRPFL